MIKQIGIENVKSVVHSMNDLQLTLYADELRKLRGCDGVYSSVLWNDIDQLFGLVVAECVERFRLSVKDEV